jgi:hypothetical protein
MAFWQSTLQLGYFKGRRVANDAMWIIYSYLNVRDALKYHRHCYNVRIGGKSNIISFDFLINHRFINLSPCFLLDESRLTEYKHLDWVLRSTEYTFIRMLGCYTLINFKSTKYLMIYSSNIELILSWIHNPELYKTTRKNRFVDVEDLKGKFLFSAEEENNTYLSNYHFRPKPLYGLVDHLSICRCIDNPRYHKFL